MAKNPLFLVTYIYFLHFFFTLIKEKSGKVGRKARKALCANGFSPPTFQIKPAKKPTFFGQNRLYKSLNSPKYIKFLKESGQKPVFQNKSGHDFCA